MSVQGFVAVLQMHVLADDTDADGALRVRELIDHAPPARELRRPRPDVQAISQLIIEALFVQLDRQRVDAAHVFRRDDAAHRHVRKQGNLALEVARDRPITTAQEHVGLNADLAHVAHRVLRWLRLQLARGGDVRDERDVHADRVLRALFNLELPQGLEEWQRLDVTDGAADLDDRHVDALGGAVDVAFDLVGDVRDDLHRRAQIFTAALLLNHALIHATSGEIRVARQTHRGEALVVTEIQIRLGAIVGDEDLAVLIRRHGTGIDIDVRVELHVRDLETPRFHQSADRRRS
jgi:hypothetical protein